MDTATQDLLYEKLREILQDEEQIVSTASVARDFKISISDANVLLTSFVNDFQNPGSKRFHVTYLLSGSLKNGDGLGVYIVKEEDLERNKSLFDTISSEFIFSIQNNKNIDANILALGDKIDATPSHHTYVGSVVGKNCVKRDIKLKRNSGEPSSSSAEKVTGKENASFFQKQHNACDKPATKDAANAKEPLVEKQLKGKNSGSISNFFTKCVVKTSGELKANGTCSKNNNKQVHTSQEQTNDVYNEVKIEKDDVNVEKMDVEDIKCVSENSQSTVGSKKRKKENKKNVSNKKRKRIQDICDSDSSDMFDDEKDEDIIEKSDEEPEPISVLKPVLMPKNKRRKAVDKTYKDEEGYVVTTTEYIFVSASEDEENEILKNGCNNKEQSKAPIEKTNSTTDSENDSKNIKNKNRKNKKASTGKQQTIMSFFKKS